MQSIKLEYFKILTLRTKPHQRSRQSAFQRKSFMVSNFQLFIQDSRRFKLAGLTHCVKVFLMLSLPTLPD